MTFWDKLENPIIVQAPMEDVTDSAFRRIIAKYGKPAVMYTEFTSADGLMSKGKDRLMHRLVYDEIERPIVAQLFGVNPENMYKSAKLVKELGFDGLNINMGCPKDSICKSGTGAGAILKPELSAEMIQAAREGSELPVDIKTRLGYTRTDEMYDWLSHILKQDVAALTVHLRTKKEMSKVPAHWELAKEIIKIRDELGVNTKILGNGDIKTVEDAENKIKVTGVDGVMIGRGIYGNPWLYNKEIKKEDLKLEQVLEVLVEHCELFDELLSNDRPFVLMRKHFKSYLAGFNNTKKLFYKLMECNNSEEVKSVASNF